MLEKLVSMMHSFIGSDKTQAGWLTAFLLLGMVFFFSAAFRFIFGRIKSTVGVLIGLSLTSLLWLITVSLMISNVLYSVTSADRQDGPVGACMTLAGIGLVVVSVLGLAAGEELDDRLS